MTERQRVQRAADPDALIGLVFIRWTLCSRDRHLVSDAPTPSKGHKPTSRDNYAAHETYATVSWRPRANDPRKPPPTHHRRPSTKYDVRARRLFSTSAATIIATWNRFTACTGDVASRGVPRRRGTAGGSKRDERAEKNESGQVDWKKKKKQQRHIFRTRARVGRTESGYAPAACPPPRRPDATGRAPAENGRRTVGARERRVPAPADGEPRGRDEKETRPAASRIDSVTVFLRYDRSRSV